jgi:hypothetical protein
VTRVSAKRNKESARRAGLLRKMCVHYMQEHHPNVVLKMRRKIDNVVRQVKKYRTRPGNEVGL